MTLSYFAQHIPMLLLGIVFSMFLIFGFIAYFAGTGLKGAKERLHQMILYRAVLKLGEKFLFPLLQRTKFLVFGFGGSFHQSVKRIIKLLREHMGAKDASYRIPWYVVVGDEKGDLLAHIPLSHPIESQQDCFPPENSPLKWWFFEKGILVDVSESCFYASFKEKKNESWKGFLKVLLHHRHARPLDGVILTIPASYFYGKGKLTQGELQKRAESLSQQLLQTEKTLGMRLPLYCVITGLEVVPGFEGFAREVTVNAQNEILGWSSPYAPTEAYQPTWVQESFEEMQGFLFESVLSVFGKGGGQTYGDDLMVFLKEFPSLEGGLSFYLNTVLRVHSYEKPFMVRGFYYTGAIPKEIGHSSKKTKIMPSLIEGETSALSKVFLKDLFVKKIFPEYGMATPLKMFLRSTSRSITALKALTALVIFLGSVSLYLGYNHLVQAQEKLTPLLEKSLHSLYMEKDHPLNELVLTSDSFKKSAQHILEMVVTTSKWPLRSSFLLPCLPSSLDDHLYEDVFKIYDRYIARPMGSAFHNQANLIMKSPLPDNMKVEDTVSNASEYDPTHTPEFLELSGYVEALVTLEEKVTLYNEFQKTGNAESLAKILDYLYGVHLPESFLEDNPVLRDKLMKEARYESFTLDSYRLDAEKRLYELYNRFLERILDPKYIYRLTAQLQETLENLDTSGIPTREVLEKALSQIKDVIAFASPKGATWLTKSELDLGDRAKSMLDGIRRSMLLNEPVFQKIEGVSRELHERAMKYLKSYGSPLSGYFFSLSPLSRRLEPSEGLIVLEKGLSLFLDQPFMAQASGSQFARTLPKGQILHWDPRILKNAMSLVESYEIFVSKELKGYPADLQDTLKVVGRTQLEQNIESMVERAQMFFQKPSNMWGKQAEDAAKFRIDNIRYAGPLLIGLLEKMYDAGCGKTFSDFKILIFSQMFDILKQLDSMIMESGYYLPIVKDFSWWKGEKKAVFQAYGMKDKEEMKAYLDNQTNHVMTLVMNYGAPIVDILKSDIFTLNVDEVVTCARWTRLLDEASAYQNKKALGSLKQLESFLLEEGNDITDKDCLDKITIEDVKEPSGDFFLQKRNTVREMLFKQCQKLNVEGISAQYDKIATYFNSFMANTFPFIRGVPDGSKIAADVSDKILQEFFAEFDKLTLPMIQTIKSSGLYDKSWKEVRVFLHQMAKVRSFVDKYFAPKIKDGDPGIDFRVEFRQNQMREKHADKVLDWAVVAGDQTASLREGNKPIRWEFGKSIAFGFQWAMNAPLQPVDIEDIDALVKTGNRSMYVYQGYWALLRAIMVHRTPPQQGGSTRNDTLLTFEIPVAPNPAMEATDKAKLFLRIVPQTAKGLSDLGFKIPEFPVVAPRLVPDHK